MKGNLKTKRSRIFFFNNYILLTSALILILSLFSLSYSRNLYDDTETLKRRTIWNKAHEVEATGGKISFEQSNEAGFFCKNKDSTFKGEFVFAVKSDYITCAFDMYPFKFEFKKILDEYLDSKFGNNSEYRKANRQRIAPHLFTIYLTYLDYPNKEKIYKLIEESKLTHYNTKPREAQLEYLSTLPPHIISRHMFNSDELKLFDLAGVALENQTQIEEVHKFILDKLSSNLNMKPFIEILSNLNTYSYWYSVVSSRSYKINIREYLRLFDFDINTAEKGKEHLELINEVTQDQFDVCLVPFFDLCNHRHPKDLIEDKIDFAFSIRKGELKVGLSKAFENDEEYSYSYQSHASNEKLLQSYGFIVENNKFSSTILKSSFTKPLITREKHTLMMKMGLIEQPFDGFFNSNHQAVALMQLIDKEVLNLNVLNIFRIYYIKNTEFKSEIVERKLYLNQWLSYENELLSLLTIRNLIEKMHINTAKLTLPDIVQSLTLTEKYYRDNKVLIEKDYEMKFKYEVRKKIMEVLRESVTIQLKNQIYVDNNTQDLLSDQLIKLKQYYLNPTKEEIIE